MVKYILLLLMILFSANSYAVENTREVILEKMTHANYCQKNSDCKGVSFGCPFGCGLRFINRSEEQAILEKINSMQEQCAYDCNSYEMLGDFLPLCKSNKCVSGKNDISTVFKEYSCADIKVVIDQEDKRMPCKAGDKYPHCAVIDEYKSKFKQECKVNR